MSLRVAMGETPCHLDNRFSSTRILKLNSMDVEMDSGVLIDSRG